MIRVRSAVGIIRGVTLDTDLGDVHDRCAIVERCARRQFPPAPSADPCRPVEDPCRRTLTSWQFVILQRAVTHDSSRPRLKRFRCSRRRRRASRASSHGNNQPGRNVGGHVRDSFSPRGRIRKGRTRALFVVGVGGGLAANIRVRLFSGFASNARGGSGGCFFFPPLPPPTARRLPFGEGEVRIGC